MSSFLLSILVFVHVVSAGDTATVCTPQPSDVVFLLDSSSSIWPEDFVRQLQFVENITKTFDIGLEENQTRIGVLTFSHKLKIELHLKDSRNKSDVISAIRRVRYLTGGTSTSKALISVKTNMFLPKNGARDKVKKITVVITDGMSHSKNATKMAAEIVRDFGVTIFAVGVGRDTQQAELQNIASKPAQDFVFHVPNFRSLQTIQQALSSQACKVTFDLGQHVSESPDLSPNQGSTLQADSTVIKKCGGKPADVYFLLDSSSSIRKLDNRKQIKFVKDVVAMFDIGENKTRIGISTFSHKYKQEFEFQSHYNKNDLLDAIDKISYLRGGTDTASALRNTRLHVFTPGVARQHVAHVLVVVTDGYSRSPKSTEVEAALLQQMGVHVFAIGVTGDVDIKELQHIASDPGNGGQSFTFNVSNFDALETIKNVLAIRACNLVDQKSGCTKDNDTDIVFLLDVPSLGSKVSYGIIERINSVTLSVQLKTKYQIGIFVSQCSDIQDQELSSALLGTERTPRYSGFTGLVKKARLSGFSVKNGGRPMARRVLIAFLDTTPTPEAEIEIKMARGVGIDFVFIVIGDEVETSRIEPYVKGQQYILKYDTNRPGQFEKSVRDKLCKGI